MKTFPHHYSSTTSLDCWHRALWCRCEFLTLPSASLCRLCFSVLRFLVSLCQLPLHISIYVRSRCCSSPASRLDVCELWDPFCAHNSHKDLLSELPQPFCQLQPVWPFSFDLSSTRHFLQQNYCSLDVTFFFVVVSYFSHNSEQSLTAVLGNPRRGTVLQYIWCQQYHYHQSHRCSVCPSFWCFMWTLTEISYAHHCCHMIG